MPEIIYPYLPEGETFDANSLNTRFQPVVDGLNGLVEVSTQRATFSDQHLAQTGLVAGEQFPASGAAGTTRYTRNIKGTHSYTVQYTTWGGNGTYPGVGDTDRELITDGVNDLQITFSAPIRLGMNNSDKIAGLLVLLNVHFVQASKTEQQVFSWHPNLAAMTCLQFTTDNVNWFSFQRTERIQWARNIESETSVTIGTAQTGKMTADEENDDYVTQDIATRALLLPSDLPDPNLPLVAVRAATAVWNPTGIPSAGTIYLREANFTIMPLHAGT